MDRLLDRVSAIETTHPAYAAHVRETIDRMIVVARSGDDPLGDAIRAELKETQGTVLVLVRKAGRVAPVQDRLTEAGGPRVLVRSSQLLTQDEIFQRIVAVGPSQWFTEALGAPRAQQMDLFRYTWVRDRLAPPLLLVGSMRSKGKHGTSTPTESDEPSETDALSEDFLEPRVAWSQIHESALRASSEEVHASEQIQAKLFLLADKHAVYVEAEEGAKSYVLDPEAESNERVELLPGDELSVGMFLILRTEGGDDRTALADRIMGERAGALREQQRTWKEKLRQLIRSSSSADVVRQLGAAGSVRANSSNLRNWAATRSIRTRDFMDFLAIMRLIDQEAEASRVWEEMGNIVSAPDKRGSTCERS